MSEACARMSKGIVTDGQKEKNKIFRRPDMPSSWLWPLCDVKRDISQKKRTVKIAAANNPKKSSKHRKSICGKCIDKIIKSR